MQNSTFIGAYLPQLVSDRNGALNQQTSYVGATVGTDRTILNAESGKKLWVPFLVITPLGSAPSRVIFKTGGNQKLDVTTIDPTDADLSARCLILPYNPLGWITSLVGTSVLADVLGGDCAISTVYYSYLP